MSDQLEEVRVAQEEYSKRLARRRWSMRLNILLVLLIITILLAVAIHYMGKEPEPKDCSNPRNANTPYCTERAVRTKSQWKSLTEGGGQSFNLTPR